MLLIFSLISTTSQEKDQQVLLPTFIILLRELTIDISSNGNEKKTFQTKRNET